MLLKIEINFHKNYIRKIGNNYNAGNAGGAAIYFVLLEKFHQVSSVLHIDGRKIILIAVFFFPEWWSYKFFVFPYSMSMA